MLSMPVSVNITKDRTYPRPQSFDGIEKPTTRKGVNLLRESRLPIRRSNKFIISLAHSTHHQCQGNGMIDCEGNKGVKEG
jgi:hypothetical protein